MGHRRDRAPVRGWSLAQLFGLTVGLLVILLGFLFTLVFRGSQDAILESSEQQRKLVSQRIADSVAAYLGQAEASIVDLQREIQGATLDLKDFTAIEAALYADLINHPNLTEVTVTYGWDDGWDADGNLRLLPGHRGQISVYRPDPAGKKINTRELSWANGGFEVRARRRGDADAFDSVPLKLVHPTTPPQDPTQDPTFTTPARQDLFGAGQPVWSDLAWTEMDKALPPAQRRVEVSVQKAITNRRGGFLGVVRVGIQAQRLDQCTRGTGLDPGDKHQVFLCDAQGRLITRVSPHDTIEEMGDDLRVHPSDPPPAIAAALHLPILGQVSADTPQQHGSFDLGGETFLTTFRYLSNTQDWIAGIVVPKSYYLGNLEDSRRRLLIAFLAIDVLLLVGGIGSLRFMRQGMHQITNETTRIGGFDFAAAAPRSQWVEVNQALESLEQAKTALRAMGKYVPMDLVRLLYQTRTDPVLGGTLSELTMMFTDISNFTTLGEQMSPNDLAHFLGLYLEAMARPIHDTEGNIDKFIGDAVMAIWNAPSAVADHPLKACRAALACHATLQALYASPAWQGRAPWHTRFGIHKDLVDVGHFGSPDRMSYTALGDGVNVASRLEGLNKQYGTTILVSEAVYESARHQFNFRRIDRVAVKGKTQGILVFELLIERLPEGLVERYEDALAHYFDRQFQEAITLLEGSPTDPPSQKLLARCRHLLEDPPPPDWNGTYVAVSK